MKIALLGCGRLGLRLARCLAAHHGPRAVVLTARDPARREVLAREFPRVTASNAEATGMADVTCILVRPADVDALVAGIADPSGNGVVVNFAARHVSGAINVACVPPSPTRIPLLLHERAPQAMLRPFRAAFAPISDDIRACGSHLEALREMSRALVHLHAYAEALEKQGSSNARALLAWAATTLDDGGILANACTPGGITESLLLALQDSDALSGIVSLEREVLSQ